MERKFYYFGLQTAPVLVADTNATLWDAAPTGTGMVAPIWSTLSLDAS